MNKVCHNIPKFILSHRFNIFRVTSAALKNEFGIKRERGKRVHKKSLVEYYGVRKTTKIRNQEKIIPWKWK